MVAHFKAYNSKGLHLSLLAKTKTTDYYCFQLQRSFNALTESLGDDYDERVKLALKFVCKIEQLETRIQWKFPQGSNLLGLITAPVLATEEGNAAVNNYDVLHATQDNIEVATIAIHDDNDVIIQVMVPNYGRFSPISAIDGGYPLHQPKAVNPSKSTTNSAEKYIQIISVANQEFWFMGFVNYSDAVKCLEEALQDLTTCILCDNHTSSARMIWNYST